MKTRPKPIIIVPLDTAAETLAEIREGGWIPVSGDAQSVRMVAATPFLEAGDLAMAAMSGLESSLTDAPRSDFFHALHKRMKANEEAANKATV